MEVYRSFLGAGSPIEGEESESWELVSVESRIQTCRVVSVLGTGLSTNLSPAVILVDMYAPPRPLLL